MCVRRATPCPPAIAELPRVVPAVPSPPLLHLQVPHWVEVLGHFAPEPIKQLKQCCRALSCQWGQALSWRCRYIPTSREGAVVAWDQYKRSPPSVTLRKRPRALRKCATATAPVTKKALARDTPTTHYFPGMRVSCDVLQRSQLAIVYFYCHLSATLLKRY